MFGCRGEKRPHIEDARMEIAARECAGVTLDPEVFRFVENGPNEISSRVFVAADFTRGRREGLSALAIVHDSATNKTSEQMVSAGDVITIGADRYCVTEIRATATSASVSLRKVVSPL